MDIYKIIVVILLACMFGCNSKNSVPKADYDHILNEYKSLKEMTNESRELNIDQAKTLSKAVEELAEISGRTTVLRKNMENGTARVTQADKISNSIGAIKSKIDELEKKVGNNAEFIKMIKNLKVIISGNETEIKELKILIKEKESVISDKENTIRAQSSTISVKNQALSAKEQELEESMQDQINIIYKAGVDFENIASQIPDVSRKSNKKVVDEYQQKILIKALLYYDVAASAGHIAAKERSDQLRKIMKNE